MGRMCSMQGGRAHRGRQESEAFELLPRRGGIRMAEGIPGGACRIADNRKTAHSWEASRKGGVCSCQQVKGRWPLEVD